MNRAEHIATAERLLQSAADAAPSEYADYAVAVAQVYATLACAASDALVVHHNPPGSRLASDGAA